MKQLAPWTLRTQDILEWCRTYKGPKFHAMLCDPPYEIGFMSKDWDNSGVVFKPELWEALMEHLHPGAFCFAFSSTRTVHRMMVAIEDAGFVIHPIMLAWNQSTGFPKASNPTQAMTKSGETQGAVDFNGHRYGLQALKPAFEPIVCFQKPYPKKIKPVVSMLETGAGCLNIDAGRIMYEAGGSLATNPSLRKLINGGNGGHVIATETKRRVVIPSSIGRWPSNILLCHLPDCRCLGHTKLNAGKSVNAKRSGEDSNESRKRGSDFAMKPGARRGGEETVPTWECVDGCPVRELGQQSGDRKVAKTASSARNSNSILRPRQGGYQKQGFLHQDSGTASRYYYQASWDMEVEERIANCVPVKYVAKPANREKNAGLESRNSHATVKPLRMVEYLAKLLLPPEGYTRRMLVPFAGSGSEMIGARQAGWERVVGIELLPEHVDIAKQRLTYWETRTLADGCPEGVSKQHIDTPLMKPKHNAWSRPRDHHPKDLW